MITISLCMIVKNEENVLARCLESLKNIVDEIIIVDTGSTDNTMEIAKKYTDKIYKYKWNDNFSDARNYSFSKATMDYVYCADADEIIDQENQEKFKNIKKVLLPEIDVVQMKYCNQLMFNTVYNYDVEYRPKLYKRIRTLTWSEPIHEKIDMNPVIYDSDIEIIHMPESNHAQRDIETFEKHIKNGMVLTKRLHNFYARELFVAGEDKNFINALPVFEETMNDSNRSQDEIMEAACVIVKASRIKGDIKNFFKNVLKNVVCGSCSEICYELGEYYFAEKDYSEAAAWFYNAAYETESILNIHCGGDLPLYGLSKCYKMLGMNDKADEYENEARNWERK